MADTPSKPGFDLSKAVGHLGEHVKSLAQEGTQRLSQLEQTHLAGAHKALEADDLDGALAHILQAKFYRDMIVASKKV